jgi:hypothetical protein
MQERRRSAIDKDMKKNTFLIQLQKLIFLTRKFKGKCSFQPTKLIIFMKYLKRKRFSSCQRINEGTSARCLLTSEENVSMKTDLFTLFRKIAKSDY